MYFDISTPEQALPNSSYGYLEAPALFGDYNYPSDSLPVAGARKLEVHEIGKPGPLCGHKPLTLACHTRTRTPTRAHTPRWVSSIPPRWTRPHPLSCPLMSQKPLGAKLPRHVGSFSSLQLLQSGDPRGKLWGAKVFGFGRSGNLGLRGPGL